MSNIETSEFGVLYEKIRSLLAQYGVDDPLGQGDYDICADNYNNRDFYVLVNNISVIYPDWVSSIQGILRYLVGQWIVHIRLGIPATVLREAIDSPGLEITSGEAKELWDKAYLVRTFGRDFHFS